MKILVAAGMCLLLFSAECLAISGGPDYGSQVSVTGSFAGVLAARSCAGYVPPPGSLARCNANSIGIFSITVPRSGQATGPLVIFNEGQTYVGTVSGTADPQRGTFQGLIDANFTYSTQVLSGTETTTKPDGEVTVKETFTNQSYEASAAGQMNARVKAIAQTFGTAGLRLVGNATVQYALSVGAVDDEIAYKVLGFKQAELGP